VTEKEKGQPGRRKTNLNSIKKGGIEKFIGRQNERIGLLERMLKDFDDGRSKSFYCIAATLLPISKLESSLSEAQQKIDSEKTKADDIKSKAIFLKEILNDYASEEGIELKLRKKPKK